MPRDKTMSTKTSTIVQHSIILHSEDVLTPASIQKVAKNSQILENTLNVHLMRTFFQMYQIYKAVYAIKTEQNKTWEECCLREGHHPYPFAT